MHEKSAMNETAGKYPMHEKSQKSPMYEKFENKKSQKSPIFEKSEHPSLEGENFEIILQKIAKELMSKTDFKIKALPIKYILYIVYFSQHKWILKIRVISIARVRIQLMWSR